MIHPYEEIIAGNNFRVVDRRIRRGGRVAVRLLLQIEAG